MPSPILHLGASVLCKHAGLATPAGPFPSVLVSAQPVVTLSNLYSITACSLSATSTPPCATGQFIVGATRVFAGGVPVAIFDGTSTCVPTATPMQPVVAQTRVLAT
jgi:hypothetical protein